MKSNKLKKEIKTVVPKGYKLKTNFKTNDFLVEIDNIIISAKPVYKKNKIEYEFLLDTQFLNGKEIKYDELLMVKKVIEILEKNKERIVIKFKSFLPYKIPSKQEIIEDENEKLLESLKSLYESKIVI